MTGLVGVVEKLGTEYLNSLPNCVDSGSHDALDKTIRCLQEGYILSMDCIKQAHADCASNERGPPRGTVPAPKASRRNITEPPVA